jgi:hypothetical protein
MGAGEFFQNISAPLSLMTSYRMSLISAGSISLDSTFKPLLVNWKGEGEGYEL